MSQKIIDKQRIEKGSHYIIIGFLLIRRRPLKDLKQLGIISMGYGYGLFILGMLVVIGINLQPGYLIPNIIMFILTIPVFIMGLILLFKGLHLYRE